MAVGIIIIVQSVYMHGEHTAGLLLRGSYSGQLHAANHHACSMHNLMMSHRSPRGLPTIRDTAIAPDTIATAHLHTGLYSFKLIIEHADMYVCVRVRE